VPRVPRAPRSLPLSLYPLDDGIENDQHFSWEDVMAVRIKHRSLGNAAVLALIGLLAACAAPGPGPELGPGGR
jgi:hypothetical protein